MELTERQKTNFLNKIIKSPSGCWLWSGATHTNGYGALKSAQKSFVAHRFSYEFFVGPIPDGLFLDHLCRIRTCVNPAHLEPVSNRENILRGISPSAIAAKKTHCSKGHPYDEINTYRTPKNPEWRVCRICRHEKEKNLRLKRGM